MNTAGHRNGRSNFGLFTRRTITQNEVTTKANNAPRLVMLAIVLMGTKPVNKAIAIVTMMQLM